MHRDGLLYHECLFHDGRDPKDEMDAGRRPDCHGRRDCSEHCSGGDDVAKSISDGTERMEKGQKTVRKLLKSRNFKGNTDFPVVYHSVLLYNTFIFKLFFTGRIEEKGKSIEYL